MKGRAKHSLGWLSLQGISRSPDSPSKDPSGSIKLLGLCVSLAYSCPSEAGGSWLRRWTLTLHRSFLFASLSFSASHKWATWWHDSPSSMQKNKVLAHSVTETSLYKMWGCACSLWPKRCEWSKSCNKGQIQNAIDLCFKGTQIAGCWMSHLVFIEERI